MALVAAVGGFVISSLTWLVGTASVLPGFVN